MVSAEDLERIVHLAHDRGIYLLLDECYVYLNYAGKAVSGGSFTWAKEHMVVLGSLSKTYSMTGWRAGFALASKPVVANLSKLQSQSTSNASSIVQKAADRGALGGSQECVSEFRAEFIELRDYMLAKLAEIPGVTCTKPEGAFYVYPNISAFLGKGGIQHRHGAGHPAAARSPRGHRSRRSIRNRRAYSHFLPCHQAKHRRRNPPHGRIPQTAGYSSPGFQTGRVQVPLRRGGSGLDGSLFTVRQTFKRYITFVEKCIRRHWSNLAFVA